MKNNVLWLILFTLLFIVSCAKDPVTGTLEVNLRHKVGDKDLILNEWIYESPAGHPYKVRRLQQLISDFELTSVDGTVVSFDMYHFYEFGRSELKRFQLTDIPPGEYNRISFVFGLDEEKNKDNAYPDDYDMIGFKWPSQLGIGYHYMRFEVTSDSMGSGVIKDFNLHTGATNGNQNFLRFTFQVDPFVIENNEFSLDLIMDLNEWLENPEIYDFEDFGFGIMGNQEAQDLLKSNGVDVFSAEGPVLVRNYSR